MAYTTINKSSDHFNTKAYTGNGGTNAITGVGFQPDMVWIKEKNGTNNHEINDVVRGVNYQIYPNLTNAQTNAANHLTTFGTDGFTVGSDGALNTSSNTYLSWNWKAGNSAGSSNGNGSITSTVSVNTTAGFSIVKYVGNATSGATVGHGLGAIPDAIILKNLTNAGAQWTVYHQGIGNTKGMQLDSTAAAGTSAAYWNNTSPSSTVFTLGNGGDPNGNGANTIAYCFKSIKGYSKFGTYIGNQNDDGPFIYTGFKPAWIMLKNSSDSQDWQINDNRRPGYNYNHYLIANTNAAEVTGDNWTDFTSNGFKLRKGQTQSNRSDDTYIYMAFAEAPLVGSNNIPCTAR